MTNDLRVVFMGTPEFAVASLSILIDAGVSIVGVITAPDKPKGRGQKIIHSPVKEYALSQDLNILQPINLKDETFLSELKDLKADLQVVVAFRMLPEVVWNMPPKGTFNLHGSLLPQYRGAAPINWAIINGEKETGVTTFFLQHQIDTGDIIFQEKETISRDDNVGDVYIRLMHKGAKLVLKTYEAIAQDSITTQPQNTDQELKSAPKIFKETCEIDWNKDNEKIYNMVRGLSPYPAAWTTMHDKKCKIYKVEVLEDDSLEKAGEFHSDGKNFLKVTTGSGVLGILELQLEGKKKMDVQEFLRGYKWPSA